MKNNREKGKYGEDLAVNYLIKLGYFIEKRNFLKKWGELDIIAIKDNIPHFFEVKSVMDSDNGKGYRPEENVHNLKVRRLKRVIQSYLNEVNYGLDCEFKFHIITININKLTGEADIRILKDIIL